MPLFLILLFPILELIVFIQIGARIGVLWTLFFIFASAAIGMSIIRNHSALSVIEAQKKMMQGRMPIQEIGQSLWVALAGMLLIIPGFITSAVGALLLLPLTRKILSALILKGLTKKGFVYQQYSNVQEKEVQDAYVVEEYRITRSDGRSETRHTIEGEFEEK